MTSMVSVPAYLSPGVPVVQPPHLEGDETYGTEILPGPPPLVSVQQSAPKRDPKKPAAVVSYLPASDPGSTYSSLGMAGTLGALEDGPMRKRARVDDKSSSGTTRAQRASARNLNGSANTFDGPAPNEIAPTSSSQPMIDLDTSPIPPDIEGPSISRSSSALNAQEDGSASTDGIRTSTRKEKGKWTERDGGISRVKEEPQTVSLAAIEPVSSLLNEDHCSACRSQGALVYCDGCPRAFHLWCLDPPMEAVDLPEGDSDWFCPSCMIRKKQPKPSKSFIAPLIRLVETSIPAEYQLPDDIRGFFKDVSTGARGAYVDSSEIKQPRLNRHGQLEDRDPHRLKDRNGVPVLCFRCGMSALPGGLVDGAPTTRRSSRSSSTSVPSESWKSIISCDYCNLHWHLDCLDPPLPSMPSFGKKWMCPNHADQALRFKRRIPKHNNDPIEITKPNQFNNGNIEIIHPEMASHPLQKVSVDEVLINGRRYRVPERVITLDFWRKLGKARKTCESSFETHSGMSSPLTSLSSLEDEICSTRPRALYDAEDITVAQLLCNLHTTTRIHQSINPLSIGTHPKTIDAGTQTGPDQMGPQLRSTIDISLTRGSPKPSNIPNGVHSFNNLGSNSTPMASTSSSKRRRKPANKSFDERGSRGGVGDLSLGKSMSTKGSSVQRAPEMTQVPAIQTSSSSSMPAKAKRTNPRVKIETEDPDLAIGIHTERGASFAQPLSTTTSLALEKTTSPRSSQPKRNRHPRGTVQNAQEVIPEEKTRKDRGKKRKEPHSDADAADVREPGGAVESGERRENAKKKRVEKQENDRKQKRKSLPTSTPQEPTSSRGLTSPQTKATNSSPIVPSSLMPPRSTPTTPSLKIRLRLPYPGAATTQRSSATNSIQGKPQSSSKETLTPPSTFADASKLSGPSTSSKPPSP